MCREGYLESGEDLVPQMTVVNCLKRIRRNPITYKNSSYLRKMVLILERQVNYFQYIIVTIDTANIRMLWTEVIQVISDIGQEKTCF